MLVTKILYYSKRNFLSTYQGFGARAGLFLGAGAKARIIVGAGARISPSLT